MLSNPRIGQAVMIRYNSRLRCWAKHLHGRAGIVLIRGIGRPRNHLIHIDGTDYVIPCGHLFPASEDGAP